MRLLVFLQGTVIMHRGAVNATRGERVAQSRAGTDPSLHEYGTYVPIGNAIGKLQGWREQGAQISYLTSHRDPTAVAQDYAVLERHGFPSGQVLARDSGENYGDVAFRAKPDLLIEDDCESIGPGEITYFQVPPNLRRRVRLILVPEFGGIDHLPDSLKSLRRLASRAGAAPS